MIEGRRDIVGPRDARREAQRHVQVACEALRAARILVAYQAVAREAVDVVGAAVARLAQVLACDPESRCDMRGCPVCDDDATRA